MTMTVCKNERLGESDMREHTHLWAQDEELAEKLYDLWVEIFEENLPERYSYLQWQGEIQLEFEPGEKSDDSDSDGGDESSFVDMLDWAFEAAVNRITNEESK